MELKYKNWNDININIFQKLQSLLNNTVRTDDELIDTINDNITLLSILCDVDEDEIANLSQSEFSNLIKQTSFLQTMPKAKIKNSYIINGKKYNVYYSIQDMSMSQYIDFQTFCKEKDKYIKEILGCFLIPVGCKYGDGYKISDVVEDIGNHLSIVDAHSIMFFFTLLYRTLTKTTLGYLEKKMKKMKKKMTQEQITKTEEAITAMKAVVDLL